MDVSVRTSELAPGQVPREVTPLFERILLAALVTVVAAHFLAFAVVVAQRVVYPFELEWMEGALVDHTGRILAGKDVYTAPGVEHISYLYTPLYYYLSAAVSTITGPGFFPLRLVALVSSLGCGIGVALLVGREPGAAGRFVPGFVAGGLFFAGFWHVDGWHDLARNDSLFLVLLVTVVAILRGNTTRRMWLAGGVVTIAFLAKQLTLLLLPALAIAMATLSFRRAVCFTASTTIGLVITVGVYTWATDQWFWFFVFELPQRHATAAPPFWSQDMRPLWVSLILAVVFVVTGLGRDRRRETLFYGIVAVGLLVATYSARHHAGGHINALMPWLVGAGMLLGLLLRRSAGWPIAPRVLLQLALIGQFAWLCDWQKTYLPRPEHAIESAKFQEFLRAADGEVLVPFHGFLAASVDQPSTMHGMAMHDLQSSQTEEYKLFLHSMGAAYTARRFKVIVIDEPLSFVFFPNGKKEIPGYRRLEALPYDPSALVPLHGMATWPALVFERID